MDLKLLKVLCGDGGQHHVMFHELCSVGSLLCVARNVRFEVPCRVLCFGAPFLMIFKYYAWASYDFTSPSRRKLQLKIILSVFYFFLNFHAIKTHPYTLLLYGKQGTADFGELRHKHPILPCGLVP